MTRGLQTAEIADAIAYISEQIDSLRKEHSDFKNEVTKELRQWSNINLEMIRVLQDQSQWQPKLMKQQLQQTQHLLRCAETSERLGTSTQSLTTSTNGLLLSTEELKTQSVKLSGYLQSDQAQRLELLQSGLKSLLEKMGYQTETAQNGVTSGQKKLDVQTLMPAVEKLTQISSDLKMMQNFRGNRWLKAAVYSTLVGCIALSLGLWSVRQEAIQSNRRASWILTKLERLENLLGVK
ncbi:MAG: hypothetical protein AAF716_03825 [Cyanobacteria bacterium P01_D01_bin.1]